MWKLNSSARFASGRICLINKKCFGEVLHCNLVWGNEFSLCPSHFELDPMTNILEALDRDAQKVILLRMLIILIIISIKYLNIFSFLCLIHYPFHYIGELYFSYSIADRIGSSVNCYISFINFHEQSGNVTWIMVQ